MIEVIETANKADLQQAWGIRKEVFVKEQQCAEEIEWEFEEESTHYLAFYNGIAVGTARWRETEKGIKLERFAVLKDYRKMQVGSALLKAILNATLPLNKQIYLHAQVHAQPFYAKYGFEPTGSLFEEAGIVHIKMVYAGNT
jgi:predicted GNAT family N-acyltransferase